MDRFPIEHAGLAPSSAVLLTANNWLHGNWGTEGNVEFEVMIKVSREESHCTAVNTKLSNWENGTEILTNPVTLMLTVLPTTEAGTRHLTEVDESNVVLDAIELKFANTMRQTVIEPSKIADEADTTTMTDPNRENGGFKTTLGTGTAGGGGAVWAGGAAVVVGVGGDG